MTKIIQPKYFDVPLKLYNQSGEIIDSYVGWVENYKLSINGFKCKFTYDLRSGEIEWDHDEQFEYHLLSLNIFKLTDSFDYLLIGVFSVGVGAETLIGRFPTGQMRLKEQLKTIDDFSK